MTLYYDFDALLEDLPPEEQVIRKDGQEHVIVQPLPAIVQLFIEAPGRMTIAEVRQMRDAFQASVPSLHDFIEQATMPQLKLLLRIILGLEDSQDNGAVRGNGCTESETASPDPSPATAEATDATP